MCVRLSEFVRMCECARIYSIMCIWKWEMKWNEQKEIHSRVCGEVSECLIRSQRRSCKREMWKKQMRKRAAQQTPKEEEETKTHQRRYFTPEWTEWEISAISIDDHLVFSFPFLWIQSIEANVFSYLSSNLMNFSLDWYTLSLPLPHALPLCSS